MSNKILTFRCKNGEAHKRNGKAVDGHVVGFVGKNFITMRCTDAYCRHWTTLKFDLPGINLDLRKAGITQVTAKPNQMRLITEKPTVIIEEN